MALETFSQKYDPYAALRFPEFRRFILLRFTAFFAITLQFVVLEWRVYELIKQDAFVRSVVEILNAFHLPLTKDHINYLSLGGIGMAEFIPVICFALPAGHWVDKMEKRGTLRRCCVVSFCFAVILAVLLSDAVAAQSALHPMLTLGLIYAVVAGGGISRTFFGPTLFSIFATLVPRTHYANAATWNSSAFQTSVVLGAATGGVLISAIGSSSAMLVIAGLFAFAFWVIGGIAPRPPHASPVEEKMVESLKSGIGFVFKHPVILGALSLDLFAVLFGGAVAMLPAFAKDVLHTDALGFGILRGAIGVGSCSVMLALAFFPIRKNIGKKLLFVVAGYGAAMIVFGVSRNFALSFAALLFAGIFDGISVVSRQSILQLETPAHMRGRVASVNTMFLSSSNELGAAESGAAAQLFGLVKSVVIGGSITMLIAGGMATFNRALRRFQLDFSEKKPG